jgi:hypothetical protein
VQFKKGLIHPVYEPGDGGPSLKHEIDEVGRSEILHVVDSLLAEAGLVPDVEAVDLAQGMKGP